MNRKILIKELNRNIEVFKNLLGNLPVELIHWKANSGKWCLLEIICYLYDEEREDFRARLKHILENPELPMKSIDPAEWVTKRKYSEKDYNNVLDNFVNGRSQSVEWLTKLDSQNWDNVHRHPKIGDITAEMIFTNWLAHDYLHIRQIIKLKYDYLKSTSGKNLSYAGDW